MNLESSFLQDYPVFQIIFCIASQSDPVLQVVEKLEKKYPFVDTLVIIGIFCIDESI